MINHTVRKVPVLVQIGFLKQVGPAVDRRAAAFTVKTVCVPPALERTDKEHPLCAQYFDPYVVTVAHVCYQRE